MKKTILLSNFLSLVFLGGSFISENSFSLDKPAVSKIDSLTFCLPRSAEELLSLEALIALEKNFFQEQGLNVKIKLLGRRPSVVTEVADDKSGCDIGGTSPEAFYETNVRPEKIVPLQSMVYGLDYDTHLIVSEKSGIKSIKDLKGKTIRIGQLPALVALRRILEKAGLKEGDVKLVRGQAPVITLEQQLEKGEVDGAICWLPVMPVLVASGKFRILESNIIGKYVMPYMPHTVTFANAKFEKEHGDIVEKFLEGTRLAIEYTRKNPSELIYALQRNIKIFGLAEWKVTPSVAERAGEIVGGPHAFFFNDLIPTKNSNEKLTIRDTFIQLADLLFKEKIISFESKNRDLSVWDKQRKTKNIAQN
jgi:ABC-type nitrate/sulfonate/bicarbonate transport system substrate-binding protein